MIRGRFFPATFLALGTALGLMLLLMWRLSVAYPAACTLEATKLLQIDTYLLSLIPDRNFIMSFGSSRCNIYWYQMWYLLGGLFVLSLGAYVCTWAWSYIWKKKVAAFLHVE